MPSRVVSLPFFGYTYQQYDHRCGDSKRASGLQMPIFSLVLTLCQKILCRRFVGQHRTSDFENTLTSMLPVLRLDRRNPRMVYAQVLLPMMFVVIAIIVAKYGSDTPSTVEKCREASANVVPGVYWAISHDEYLDCWHISSIAVMGHLRTSCKFLWSTQETLVTRQRAE